LPAGRGPTNAARTNPATDFATRFPDRLISTKQHVRCLFWTILSRFQRKLPDESGRALDQTDPSSPTL
jgi:hypothetical protein